ncbi:serine/threonine protein kinase PRK1 KNAG_0A05430 [Huiozyma naganishii CBS 8797]|uniref:non-specific serine/threonine protein kinase n=1 Tax=Huiozyma naganishii (strain ATCC MYA-139 / BCRC 22969 / CBS 8797 / KCTC 17520 / NBRC 10181 / NCYC 3082 / Yp74L-3) TaxID=1071383 RepID=J7RF67_HUIN7|nr:hypothetical protein KNAG_0A05430 [Kazachstania naganishii CBS 8797]CCK68208.1 hypothetical protein KNAG_0A05430 [Kazachstania naganishii CBS 8797]
MNQPVIPNYPPGFVIKVGSHQAKILKYLTSGGFAQIYSVEISPKDEYTNSNIACLKRVIVPNKSGLNVLRTEVDAMKLLKNNRHVVSYIDSNAAKSEFGNGSYEVFLLMEYCERGSLLDFMNTKLRERLQEQEVLNIMNQVCQGIAAMHKLLPPLIHRDIKIENVLISGDGLFKVCDFGSVCGIIRPPRNPQELQYVQHDVMKNTTAQYRSPEMIDLVKGFPIERKIRHLGSWCVALQIMLLHYTFREDREVAILNGRYQYPAYPIYSDRLKNVVRVLLSPHPVKRPNICQLLEEISKIQNIPCPIDNFYLERSRHQGAVSVMPVNFSRANTTQFTDQSAKETTAIRVGKEISPLKPQLSPIKSSYGPVLVMTKTTPNSFNSHHTPPPIGIVSNKTIAKPLYNSLEDGNNGLENHYLSSSVPAISYLANQHANDNIRNTTKLNIPAQNSTGSKNKTYVDSETQTLEEPSLQHTRILPHISTDRTDNTGNSIVSRLGVQLRNVITNDSSASSSIDTVQETGNSIKSAIESLKNSVSGMANNVKALSVENARNHLERLGSSYSIGSNNNIAKPNSAPIIPAVVTTHTSNSLKTAVSSPTHSELSDENELYDTLHLPDPKTSFQSPSPLKYAVDRKMKASIEKRVLNLLKNAEDSPVKKTAAGYGKYTKRPKMVSPTNPHYHLVRQNSVSQTPLILSARGSSGHPVVVPALINRDNDNGKYPAKSKAPPVVPKKPDHLRPKPPKKPAHLSSLKINKKHSTTVLNTPADLLSDTAVDELEKSFKQRYPSTVS